MIDLATLPKDVMLARGQYATVRSAHEDAKKALAVECGKLGAISAQVLRAMQPDSDAVPTSPQELLATARNTLNMIETITLEIQSLAQQRAELKPKAWPR